MSTTDAPTRITASDLEPGDTLRDTDGHGRTNPAGPDYTDELRIKKRWGRADHDRWDHDSWLIAPVCENGRTASDSFAVTFDDINDRLATGRYEIVDCEAKRSLDLDALPVTPDDDVYIRFGDIPDNEHSTNHIDNTREQGVSVYAASLESVPPDTDAPGRFVPHGPKLLQVILLLNRHAYLVTGDEVGRGTDGEPLLKNIDVICDLEYTGDGFIPARE